MILCLEKKDCATSLPLPSCHVVNGWWLMLRFCCCPCFFFFYSFSCSVWWLRERCLAAKRKPLHWPPSSCGSKSARPKLDSHTSVVPVLSSRWVVLVDALSRSKKTTGQIRIDFFFASSFGKRGVSCFPLQRELDWMYPTSWFHLLCAL